LQNKHVYAFNLPNLYLFFARGGGGGGGSGVGDLPTVFSVLRCASSEKMT